MTQRLTSEVFVLRHATPERSNLPNRERPLSEIGRNQAVALVSLLSDLDIEVVYSSPFRRALESVLPFSEFSGLAIAEREDLGESGPDEQLDEVRDRLMGGISAIVEENTERNTLVCTHGGCLWGVISHFDRDFGYEDYRKIRTPDMIRICFDGDALILDRGFTFPDVSGRRSPSL